MKGESLTSTRAPESVSAAAGQTAALPRNGLQDHRECLALSPTKESLARLKRTVPSRPLQRAPRIPPRTEGFYLFATVPRTVAPSPILIFIDHSPRRRRRDMKRPDEFGPNGFQHRWDKTGIKSGTTALFSRKRNLCNFIARFNGGGGGIRTPEALSSLTVFKTAAFNHSATPPM